MTEALISVGKAILFLGGVAFVSALVVWIVLIWAYIVYVIKEM